MSLTREGKIWTVRLGAQRSRFLIGQWLAAPSDPCACDSRTGQVRDIQLVHLRPAKSHVGRAAEADCPRIPREQCFFMSGIYAPNLIGGVAADVEISFGVKREAVWETTAVGYINLRRADGAARS